MRTPTTAVTEWLTDALNPARTYPLDRNSLYEDYRAWAYAGDHFPMLDRATVEQALSERESPLQFWLDQETTGGLAETARTESIRADFGLKHEAMSLPQFISELALAGYRSELCYEGGEHDAVWRTWNIVLI